VVGEGVAVTAIAYDTETWPFARGLQSPPIVCVQWASSPEDHAVEVTRDAEDALAWIFEHDEIWAHHGAYDACCTIEWYPRLREKVFAAYSEGRVFDTMLLERAIEIGTGQGRGPLGLDFVAGKWGVPEPTKEITATHPDYPGQTFDVRRSFDLWYYADEIPEPWYSYADYDGVACLEIARRQVSRFGWNRPAGAKPLVSREDLAQMSRVAFSWQLQRNYGLKVNPDAVGELERAADAAVGRLREAALLNGFIRPKLAGRGSYKSPVRLPNGEIKYVLDTKVLKAAITEAYGGAPPVTPPKRSKGADKKTGGGNISRSRDTLQDSGEPKLEAWSEYNEWATLRAKDLKLFREEAVVHTRLGLTNTLRPTSSNPNTLNFRRRGFLIATCEQCGFEETIDPRGYKPGKEVPCPVCDKETACP
jgi:hypothetical protein